MEKLKKFNKVKKSEGKQKTKPNVFLLDEVGQFDFGLYPLGWKHIPYEELNDKKVLWRD